MYVCVGSISTMATLSYIKHPPDSVSLETPILVGVVSSLITLAVVMLQTFHQRKSMLTKIEFDKEMVDLKKTFEKEMVLLKENLSELKEMTDAVFECKQRLYPILIDTVQIFAKNKSEIKGSDLYLFKNKYPLLMNELLLYMSDEMAAEHKKFKRAVDVFERTVEAKNTPSDQIMKNLWRAKDSYLRAIRRDSPRKLAENLRKSVPPSTPGEPDVTDFDYNENDFISELVPLETHVSKTNK